MQMFNRFGREEERVEEEEPLTNPQEESEDRMDDTFTNDPLPMAPQEQGTDESRVLDEGGAEQSSPPAPTPLSSDSEEEEQAEQEHEAEVGVEEEQELTPLPTDHESLLSMGIENEKGRWVGEGEPPWVGEETDEYYITNWSGYRNYHCKWPGCQHAAVSGRPTPEAAMQDHYRYHRASDSVYRESLNEARRISLRRQGFVDERGNPL